MAQIKVILALATIFDPKEYLAVLGGMENVAQRVQRMRDLSEGHSEILCQFYGRFRRFSNRKLCDPIPKLKAQRGQFLIRFMFSLT
jgi:hypothetical protein